MNEKAIETPVGRGKPKLPEGFWATPGGKDGLQGSVEGVIKVIDSCDIADCWKSAMKSAVSSEATRTGGNFVEIHGHAQRGDNDLSVTIHIKTSKKNL